MFFLFVFFSFCQFISVKRSAIAMGGTVGQVAAQLGDAFPALSLM